MTARPSSSTESGGYLRTPPLAERPALTTPAPEHRGPHLPEQPHGAQPVVGFAGLTFVIPLGFLLAFALGTAEASLLVLGPLTTYALPVVATIAFWWQDWPGSSLRAGWSGLTDTLIVAVSAVLLTIFGQAVVSRVDLRGIFLAEPGPGHPATFPVTIALGAGAFTAMLQLTLVCEGWPLRLLGRIPAGVVALVLSFGIAVAAYLLLVNLDETPPEIRARDDLRDPGGPISAGTYGAVLIALGVWQVLVFVALRGWPFTLIRRRGPRILAGNLGTAVLVAASFLPLRLVADWSPNRIVAVGGAIVAAGLLVAMLFEGWPASRLGPAAGRTCVLVVIAVVAALLYLILSAYTGQIQWGRATANDWVGLAALNYLSLSVVLHVAVWRRWPVVAGPHLPTATR